MPNYNQSGGVSRQDRNRLQNSSSSEKSTMKNLGLLFGGFIIVIGVIIYKVVLNYGDSDGTVTFASYAPWIIAGVGAALALIGVYGMNGQNSDVVAKRQIKAERKAQKKSQKAERKAAKSK